MDDVGKRTRHEYRGENMYVFTGERSMSISMVSLDIEDNTLEGLDVIGSLVSLLLENEVDKEIIAGVIWENSRNTGSLADILARVLTDGNS